MIASVRGTVQAKTSDSLTVEVGTIGLKVFTSPFVIEQTQLGEEIFFFTHLVVREDLLALYGFRERTALEVFELMLGVSGIGPRTALTIVSVLSPDAVRRAVLHEQPEIFSRVPGVGKKTAQKIILALQDKIGREPQLGPIAEMGDVDTEVLAALTALGYSVVEAQAAIQSIPRDAEKDVESRLRLALQYFST